MKRGTILLAVTALSLAAAGAAVTRHETPSVAARAGGDAAFRDGSDGGDWPGYGRTYGEQHYSPLSEINERNVAKLGLAWSMDLGVGNPATIPVEVGGVLYFSSGLSIVHAVDATTGRQLWEYDSKTGEVAGDRLRAVWGIRGIAWWNGKVYTGTADGRLIAIDAKTGKPVWTVQTTEPNDGRYITGAPRVFDGRIIIGHGGADTTDTRGYVTTYDAETGKQLWRFFIVPGNPAKGFENKTMEMAAKTWTGEWWKYGGGGAAWNAFAYDPDTDTVFVGTGNGAPWNQHIRSPGGGDNLFLCSIVAVDAKTGAYKWHYQVNPGESWDFNAAMDMELADLVIDGQHRKVIMQAPKNGFFYVIDRLTGKLISAQPITKVTWATRIDLKTGRPVEVAGARFPNGQSFEMWPDYTGAHSWMPMAYSPQTQLVYIPKLMTGAVYHDRGIDPKTWKRISNGSPGLGEIADAAPIKDPLQNTSELLAWNPVTQRKAWSVKTVGGWNGGVLATGGNLVFQGQIDGRFSAYAADSGRELWHFPAQAAVIAAPISYRVNGRQYVTVLVGMGTSAGADARTHPNIVIDNRTQHKRVLTFMLDGGAHLPVASAPNLTAAPDPDYRPDPALAAKGASIYAERCISCHGFDAVSGGAGPDLRRSPVPASAEAFEAIVRGGALNTNGMPTFHELSDADLAAVRQYLRSRAADLRAGRP